MPIVVIERFRDTDMVPDYQQVRDAGRMLPEGLEYVDSRANRTSGGASS